MASGPVAPTLATPSEHRITRLTGLGAVSLHGQLVAQPQAGFGVGRAFGVQGVDGVQDRSAIARRWSG